MTNIITQLILGPGIVLRIFNWIYLLPILTEDNTYVGKLMHTPAIYVKLGRYNGSSAKTNERVNFSKIIHITYPSTVDNRRRVIKPTKYPHLLHYERIELHRIDTMHFFSTWKWNTKWHSDRGNLKMMKKFYRIGTKHRACWKDTKVIRVYETETYSLVHKSSERWNCIQRC